MLRLSYSVMVTQRFLVPHFLVRVRVGQPPESQPVRLALFGNMRQARELQAQNLSLTTYKTRTNN